MTIETPKSVKAPKKTALKRRKRPQVKAAKQRRAKATARVYVQKFREDPRQALRSMVECLMAGDVQFLKEQIKAQYEALVVTAKMGLRKRVGV